ncbi:MAG: hypothetical protein ACKOUM_01265, partial [Sphingopyxis sp.]
KLTLTVIVQALGMMLVLATSLFVARMGGAQAQGALALVKSVTDLQVAICSLGLPSGMIFMLNKTGTGHRPLFRLSIGYGAVLLLVLSAFNAGLLAVIRPALDGPTLALTAILLGVAAALSTAYALQRGVALVRTDGLVFSLLSVMPAVVISLTIVALLNRAPHPVEIAYALSGLLCVVASSAYLRHSLRGLPRGGPGDVDWAMLRRQSSHVFFQAVILGLQFFLSNAWLEWMDASLALAGLFAIASMAVTLPNQLVAMVSPILYNRWSQTLDVAGFAVVRRNILVLAAGAQVLAFIGMALVPYVVPLIFGAPFAAAVPAVCVLLCTPFAVVAGRVLTPALQGMGDVALVTWSCAVRLVLIGIAVPVVRAMGLDPLLAISTVWVVGEYGALAVLMLASIIHRRRAAAMAV